MIEPSQRGRRTVVEPQNGTDGEDLLVALRRAGAARDPVPDLVHECARAALSMRDLDAQLLELTADSAERSDALAVRQSGRAQPRLLSFETRDLSVEVYVDETDRRLVAHVLGTELAAARLETPAQRRNLDVHEPMLVADEVPPGPVRLHLTTREGATYTTSWAILLPTLLSLRLSGVGGFRVGNGLRGLVRLGRRCGLGLLGLAGLAVLVGHAARCVRRRHGSLPFG